MSKPRRRLKGSKPKSSEDEALRFGVEGGLVAGLLIAWGMRATGAASWILPTAVVITGGALAFKVMTGEELNKELPRGMKF